MSTHKNIDRICVVITVLSLLLTILFMNGEALGIEKIVDADAESYVGTEFFTANDQNGAWDTASATVIALNGSEVKITGTGAYAYDGGVVISNAGYYVISGTLTDGSITVDAYRSSKVWIMLSGVDITCSDDACIRVDQAEKVFLTLAEGSENTLSSGADYSSAALADGTDGAIFAHDDLTINGSGSLTVTAAYRHGIAANDKLVITDGTITVSAPQDGIHVNDSLCTMEAKLSVEAGDDGIDVDGEDGFFYMDSGILTVSSADDGIHTVGDLTIAGGTLQINAGNDGIHSDAAVTITDGSIEIPTCYEGIEAITIDISGGEIVIYPTDDGLNANGGSNPSGAMGQMGGMGTPPDLQASGSDGSGSLDAPEAMQSSSQSSPESETWIRISGGSLSIINGTARDADGLDSNGDIIITGGTIRISLTGEGSNCAIDYGSESGSTATIFGGSVIACGGSSMAEGFSSSSTQGSILCSFTQTQAAGTAVCLLSADGSVLLRDTPACSFSSVVLSCPEMVEGETYTLVIGEQTQSVTLDSTSVTVGETGSMTMGGAGAMDGEPQGGSFEAGEPNSDPPETPDMPQTGERPEMPDMSQMGERPEMPDASQKSPVNPFQNGGEWEASDSGQSVQSDMQSTDKADVGSNEADPLQTWLLLGGSALVLAAGLAAARSFRRRA